MTTLLWAGYSTCRADIVNLVFRQFKGHNSGDTLGDLAGYRKRSTYYAHKHI